MALPRKPTWRTWRGAAATKTRDRFRTSQERVRLAGRSLQLPKWVPSLPEDYLDTQILVANLSTDASTTIYFEFLPERIRSRVRILEYRSGMDIAEFGRAGCLIVVRHLDPFRRLTDAAFALGIPCCHFLDDNFTLLQSKKETALDENHSVDALKRKLKDFAGVLLSTPGLMQFYEKSGIHPNRILMPPCFSNWEPVVGPPAAPERNTPVRMAFVGGKHRHPGLKRVVLPAIAGLAKRGFSIHFAILGADDDLRSYTDRFRNPCLTIECEPFDIDWNRCRLKASGRRPHFAIHAPSDSDGRSRLS